MWNAIAQTIIKATDNMNRGVENASKAGEGNNGQSYQISDSGASGGGGGYTTPGEQDVSAATSLKNNKVVEDIKNFFNKKEEKEGQTENPVTSDERLKNIFGDNEDAIKAFSKLKSIQFTYTDKAREVHPGEENGVDNDLHYGIKAQDLEKNPFTAAVVSKDPEGYKQVDPSELTAANTAVIAEICKRILIIEKILGIKVE